VRGGAGGSAHLRQRLAGAGVHDLGGGGLPPVQLLTLPLGYSLARITRHIPRPLLLQRYNQPIRITIATKDKLKIAQTKNTCAQLRDLKLAQVLRHKSLAGQMQHLGGCGIVQGPVQTGAGVVRAHGVQRPTGKWPQRQPLLLILRYQLLRHHILPCSHTHPHYCEQQ
jgi:hypothetical protein